MIIFVMDIFEKRKRKKKKKKKKDSYRESNPRRARETSGHIGLWRQLPYRVGKRRYLTS